MWILSVRCHYTLLLTAKVAFYTKIIFLHTLMFFHSTQVMLGLDVNVIESQKFNYTKNLVLGVWSIVAGYLNQPIKFHCERDCKKLYLDQSLKLHNPTIVFLHTHTQRNTPTTVVRTHKKGHATTKLEMQSGKHFFSMTCRRNGMQRQLLHTAINTLQLFNCAQWNQLVPRFLIFTILSSNF